MKFATHSSPSIIESYRDLLQLLNQRFGDGSIYLAGRKQRPTFEKAQSLGLISTDGMITSMGRDFLSTFCPPYV